MRHAIVVGASSGIGAAAAAELRRRGWIVSGLSRRTPPTDHVDAAFPCDVRDEEALRRALEAARRQLGPPDALVWCAGEPVMGRTLEVPRDAARSAFETSFWALDAAVRATAPVMIERGGGSILIVSSLAGLRAVPHEAYYAAAKAAAARWIECLAHELDGSGLRLQCLYPGYVSTGFLERGGWWGMGRPAVRGSGVTPEDVGRTVADMLQDGRSRVVLGWRERAIVLADRIAPGLYDRMLRHRN